MKEESISKKNRAIAYLQMSRCSNLPTVWTNCLAGISLVGGCDSYIVWFFAILSLSFYYIGGMFLNDVCDREWDAKNRSNRPIPQGIIKKEEASWIAWGFLFLGNLLVVWESLCQGSFSYKLVIYGLILTASIVLYDYFHKKWIYSPFLMALCRFAIYPLSAFMVKDSLNFSLYFFAAMLGSYIIGISYLARQETFPKLLYQWPLFFLFLPLVYMLFPIQIFSLSFLFWLIFLGFIAYCSQGILRKEGQIGFYIGLMLAGISLWDALLLSIVGASILAILAIFCFFLTLASHRIVSGT